MSELLLMGKRIDLAQCPVLFDAPFNAATFDRDWRIRGAEWRVEDEWLIGRNPENNPGMVTSRAAYFGNILLSFEARTLLPSAHDIDYMWNGSWNDENNQRGTAYVAGLQGWWDGKVGLEKSPDYKLNALTPLFPFEPGRLYSIQAGSIDGHCFVFVDNRLCIELTDPDPIDNTLHGLIGFEAYASHIQIRRLAVRQIVWTPRPTIYAPEF